MTGSKKHVSVNVHVGKRLRARRVAMGLTQEQLARMVGGIRFQQIQKYEAGASRIPADQLWRLIEALEVSEGYFFEGLRETAEEGSTPDMPDPLLKRLTAVFDRMGVRSRLHLVRLLESIERD